MTNREFSDGFDTLVNSYRRIKDFDKQEMLDSIEFDEYEKSFYLTKAQDALVLSLYNGKNAYGDSFENTEEQRRYLSDLIEAETLTPSDTTFEMIDSKSKVFDLPSDLWFITYEAVNVDGGKCGNLSLDVLPVTQDEYHKIRKNPFRGANGRRALRLDLPDNMVEIVSTYATILSYYVRYLKKPTPIVLEDLPNGLTIKEEGQETECTLHESLHDRILDMAVRMGLESKGISMKQKE